MSPHASRLTVAVAVLVAVSAILLVTVQSEEVKADWEYDDNNLEYDSSSDANISTEKSFYYDATFSYDPETSDNWNGETIFAYRFDVDGTDYTSIDLAPGLTTKVEQYTGFIIFN